MPDKDTVTVPIPAGDHNPEVAVLEKQSRFEDLPATPPTGLRASNTVESLKPREVNVSNSALGYQTPSGGHVTLEEILAPEIALQRGLEIQAGQSDVALNSGAYLHAPVVPKTDVEFDSAGYPHRVPAPANVLPVNWPEAKATPAGEKIFRPSNLGEFPSKIAAPVKVSIPKPSYVPKKDSLEVRVERLEEQIDGLLDRIARYNQKSSHKL